MTEVTNKINIDPSLMTHLVQSITDNMKADLQQVNSRLNVLEQKVNKLLIHIIMSNFLQVPKKIN
jgi:hypothetical protein